MATKDAPVKPEAALNYWREKKLVTPDEYEELSQKSRGQAFKVAGVYNIDILQEVKDSLADALDSGLDFKDWKATIPDTLDKFSDSRLETIFRTNLQTAYHAGAYAEAKGDPDRQYGIFDSVDDDARSDICEEIQDRLGESAYPIEDLADVIPPLHHQCRSTIIYLTEEEAVAQGLAEIPDNLTEGIDEDFIGVPEMDWDPDPADYDEDFQSSIEDLLE